MTDPRMILAGSPLRIVRFAVVVATLSLLFFGLSIATGPAQWSMLLNGLLVADSGRQILKARDLIRRHTPDDLRAWMGPVGMAFYGLSVPCFLFGVLAVIHLVAAT